MYIGKNPWAPPDPGAGPKRPPSWLIIPLVLAAFSLLTAGYLSTFTPAKVIDGERVITLATHQTTVGAALREVDVNLFPEDLVTPAIDAPLNRNDTIIIQRARQVRVHIDNQDTQLVRTQSKSASGVLASLGYAIGQYDLLTVNDQPSSDLPALANVQDGATADIEFRHAQELSIQEQDKPAVKLLTTAPTIGEALLQAGYKIYLADIVKPSPGEAVKSGAQVFITRSKPVSILVDGRRLKTRTYRPTAADVLGDMHIILYGEDYTVPASNTPVSDNMDIRVVRVRHEVAIDQEVIPFDTRVEGDDSVELDQQALGQEGVPGVHERRTLVTYEDDVETNHELIADFIARQPQSKIYKYGTKIVLRPLVTPSGVVQYWRVIHMLATSYSASTAGVAKTAAAYGHVRCGFAMHQGIVAVDPSIIPLGTNVYVDGYGIGNACDTGSAINGKHIDLGFDDNSLQMWYRWVNVYLLAPVPPNIRYNID